jgi:predicted peptidase
MLIAGFLSLAVPAGAQAPQTGFLNRTVQIAGVAHRYQVYVPAGYDASSRWPVILFLHGAGERGTDGLLQTEVGLASAIRRFPARYPAIVVLPQVPLDGNWIGSSARVAMAALEKTMHEFSTDRDRVYLTGLSMGGQGAWNLAYHYTDQFAAVVVICGFIGVGQQFPSFLPADAADPPAVLADRLKALPIWVYHGDADSVVSVEYAREIVDRLRKAGAAVHYSELPKVGHNSWDAAYRSVELPAWLFNQRKTTSDLYLSGTWGAGSTSQPSPAITPARSSSTPMVTLAAAPAPDRSVTPAVPATSRPPGRRQR